MPRASRKDWSQEEDDLLRHHAVTKTPIEVVCDLFGVSAGAIRTRMSRLGGTQVLNRFQRERIVELHKDGWRLSRLAKQIGTTEDLAAVVLRKAGFDVVTDQIGPDTVLNDRRKPAPAFRFTDEQTDAIRTRMLAGERPIAIARDLDLSHASVKAKAASMNLTFRAIERSRAAAGLAAPEAAPAKRQEDELARTSAAGGWSDDEMAGLRKLLYEGKDPRDIARILGRGIRDVDTQIALIRKRDRSETSDYRAGYATGAIKARVLELHATGATSSRIARIVPMSVGSIDGLLTKEGRTPNVVKGSRLGRYGVDMPLPAPRNLDAEPLRLIVPPAKKPDPDPVDEIVDLAVEVVQPEPQVHDLQASQVDEIPDAVAEVVHEADETGVTLPASEEIREMPVVATSEVGATQYERWTDDELAYLRTADAEGATLEAIADHLGRTVTAVKKRRTILRHPVPRTRSEADRSVTSSDLRTALEAEILAAEHRIAVERKALGLMRELQATLGRARAA
ncbi:hypothetical protein [Aureimonas sp. SK2]|uniref:hypothetical protein n=1 Tax=Aureimonas sp. SK2 TaxID=3015992 RepID=UPI0024440C82|nr:hypothetical protein [Aureimonas sp. SK2]